VADLHDPTETEEPPEGADTSAWRHARDHSAIPVPTPGPGAHRTLGERFGDRMSRGSTRIFEQMTAFATGAEKDTVGEKVPYWFGSLASTAVAGFSVLHQTLPSLAVIFVGWAGAAFVKGGPRYDGLPANWHPPMALPVENDSDDEQDADEDCEPTVLMLPPGAAPTHWAPPPTNTGAPLTPGNAYIIQDQADGTSLVRVAETGEQLPETDPAHREVSAVNVLQAAKDELAAALSAKKVEIAFSGLEGGFTHDGQRWIANLTGGMTVGDVNGKIGALESAWRIPESGSVYATPNPGGRKNQVVITRIDRDPLNAERRTRRIPYGSVSIKDLAPIGWHEDGSADLISLLRKHVGIIAANGSGKSTLTWNLLNFLTACPDAVYCLIDLQSSAALRLWEKTAARCAWNLEDARELIEGVFEFSQARALRLGDNAEAFIEGDGEGNLDVNHDPSPEYPALVLIIEEASLLAEDANIIATLIRQLRTGRKGAVTVIYINQRDESDSTGSASIRKEFAHRIMMRSEESDVDRFFGKAMKALGFAPHNIRLEGVYYRIDYLGGGARNPMPRRARTTWPDPGDMRDGIREALAAGRPRIRHEETRQISIALHPETFPEALDAVVYGLQNRGQDRISAKDLRLAIARRDRRLWTPSALDTGLRDLRLTPSSIKDGKEGMNGFYLTHLADTVADTLVGASRTESS